MTVESLSPARARAGRLTSLLLGDPPLTTPVDVVTWFGAMQAQDLASGMWSLGLRLPGCTEADVLLALEEGRILRTWPMRGTIHLVPSVDAGWMLDLMGARALATGPRRRQQLGLSEAYAELATTALVEALRGGRRLTRAEALAVINDAGITTEGQRGYHLLWLSAQTGATCIGPQVAGEQTWVLLSEWVPNPRALDRRAGAAELAYRYFRSHGPTTVADFAGWTGLGLRVCQQAIADNDGRLTAATLQGQTVWSATEETAAANASSRSTRVLPGFDEFLLGFKDRSLHVPEGRLDAIVPGGNGTCRTTVITRGGVAATGRRTLTATSVKVVVDPFEPLTTSRRASVAREFERYSDFLGRRLVLTIRDP